MKISVVTVCYNSERTIAGAVSSFLSQTYDNKELLVIDGESTDRTVQIVREFASPDIRVISTNERR